MKLSTFPKEPGVYLMKDSKGIILYIGKAKSLQLRIKQYFSKSGDDREMVPYLTKQVTKIDFIVTFSEKEALLLENTLIKKHQPKYNVLLKDDKTFISLVVNHKHKWPMIKVARFKGAPPKSHVYFGPFTNATAAKETLETISRIFPLRECSDRELGSRKRPCLLYSIKRCLAPCVNKCTDLEYKTTLENAMKFLKGKDKDVVRSIKEDRDKASKALEFEKAAALQRKLCQIEHVLENRRATVHSGTKECDAFAIYRLAHDLIIVQLLFREGRLIGAESETFSKIASSEEEILESFIIQSYRRMGPPPKEVLTPFPLPAYLSDVLSEEFKKRITLTWPKKGEKLSLIKLAEKNARALFHQEQEEQSVRENLLLELEETLSLSKCPVLIECFDTSNISGSDLVAAKVSFSDGLKNTSGYRLFTIRDVTGPDDYGAMREVLMRHFTRAQKEDSLPDLAIIDGGKGQLNIALEVFLELGIANVDLIALTKEEGRHSKGLSKERIFLPYKKEAIALSPTAPALHFLQRIRDEAHRFAITFHKKKRSKRTIKSQLDSVSGIGPAKKKALLKHFGSVKQIKEASEEELLQVVGITKTNALSLLEQLN